MFMWLYEHFPQTTFDLLSQYPTLGYWKDLSQLYLLAHQTKNGPKWNNFKRNIVCCFTNQLTKDAAELNRNSHSTNVSLCAKYVPKEGRSFDKKTKITKAIASQLYPELFKTDFRKAMKKFRTLYTRLNRHIDTVEIKECSGRWSEIDFNRVPGRALNIQRKAFLNTTKSGGEELRHPDSADRMKCRENFQSHLQKAVRGEVKVKGKTMFIHELVEQIMNGRLNTQDERVLIESQWNAHVDHFRQTMEETNSSLGKGLCLVDVSGSMSGTPMNVAIAMGISTYKMHNGHRGINHPVINLKTGKGEISSQNHGFAINRDETESHPDVEITHVHLNDNTIAGISIKNSNCFSVQYHPEASPGPHDSNYLFDEFVQMIKNNKK